MKSCRLKMNKIGFVRGYSFGKLLRVLLCLSLCFCTGLFLPSCTNKGRRQTFLKNTSLPAVSKVAIVASVSDPKVISKIHDGADVGGLLAALFPPALPVVLAYALTESAIRSSVEKADAGEVKKRMDLAHIEEKMAQSFMETVKKGDFFKNAEYLTDKDLTVQQLAAKGYDAVIRLSLQEISLRQHQDKNFRIWAAVFGQMEYLSSGKVVWDRYEVVTSPESHSSLNYYKENGLKELDAMLERAGRNLADDFAYLK